MSKELFFLGRPAPFQKGLYVYPPLCIDVMTNSNYNAFVKMLTYSQEEIEDLFVKESEKDDKKPETFPTPLEFLLANCYNNEEYKELCEEAFYFFMRQKITILYEEKMILVGQPEEILLKLKGSEDLETVPYIDETNFFDLQNLIREAIGIPTVAAPDPMEHPRLKAMKAKQRLRDAVKAKQAAKNGISFLDSVVAICCMGIGITPLNIGEMSYVAIRSIIDRYQAKERYDLDIRSILAGGDSKKIKPKYWMEKLEN